MEADPDRADVQGVCERAWAALSPRYRIASATDVQLQTWRRLLTRDVWFTIEVLTELGLVAVEPTAGWKERRSTPVRLTELGQWAIRRSRGGA